MAQPSQRATEFVATTSVGSASAHGSGLSGQTGWQDPGGVLGTQNRRVDRGRTGSYGGSCSARSATFRPGTGCEENFRTGEQGLFSVPYTETTRTGPIAAIGAFELRR